MTNHNNTLVAKIWSFCDTLRDDGLGYNEYLEQLTYLLFLKMAHENINRFSLPDECTWTNLVDVQGGELLDRYENILRSLATAGGMLEKIFNGSQNKISDSSKLRKLILLIDDQNWTLTGYDIKGEIYESLLQKNAENSGAGQYFTPRPVIASIVACVQPISGETIADPSCGTGGFFLGVLDFFDQEQMSDIDLNFLRFKTFHGWEIEKATARLCLMNLYLHGIGDLQQTPDIYITDSLKRPISNKVDIVLANPPFGKSSSDVPTTDVKLASREGYYLREDFWITTSNKQFAFLQHIVTMLRDSGRAAVVLPDNVLFEGGAGETIRRKLLDEVNLHTILRLPTGIFYAQGVKANVLFFDRTRKDNNLNREIWYYDYRTNIHHSPKKNPITADSLSEFVSCYKSGNNSERVSTWSLTNLTGRWRKYSYQEIASRDKFNLDITWLKDDSLLDIESLPDPDLLVNEIIENLESALSDLKLVRDTFSQV